MYLANASARRAASGEDHGHVVGSRPRPRSKARRAARLSLVSLAAVVTLGACSSGDGESGSAGASSADGEPLQVSVSHLETIANSAVFIVADEMGYYEDEGLTVTLSGFEGGGDTVRAVTTGGFDIGSAATLALVSAFQAGEPVSVIANSSYSSMSFLVLPDSELETIDDVRGATIAYTSPGSASHGEAILSLQEAGIDLSEVDLVSVGGAGDAIAALESGAVDVAVGMEPNVSDLVAEGRAEILWGVRDVVGESILNMVLTRPDLIEERGDDLRRFLAAIERANELCNDDAEQCAEAWIAHDEVGYDLETAIGGIEATEWSSTVTSASLSLVEETMEVADVGETPVDWDSIIDGQLLESAIVEDG